MPQSRHQVVELPLAALEAAFLQSCRTAGDSRWVLAPSAELVASAARRLAGYGEKPPELRYLSWRDLALGLTEPERRTGSSSAMDNAVLRWNTERFLQANRQEQGFLQPSLAFRSYREALAELFVEFGNVGLWEPDSIERLLLRHHEGFSRKTRALLEMYLSLCREHEGSLSEFALLSLAARTPAGRFEKTFESQNLLVYAQTFRSPAEQKLLQHLSSDPSMRLQIFEIDTSGQYSEVPSQVVSSPSEESENVEICRRILSALDDGISLQEMAVFVPDDNRVEHLAHTLKRAGLPHTRMHGPVQARTRLGRSLTRLLDLIEHGPDARRLMDFFYVAPIDWQAWCGLSHTPSPAAWARLLRDVSPPANWKAFERLLGKLGDDAEKEIEEREGQGEPSTRWRSVLNATRELKHVVKTMRRFLDNFPRRAPLEDYARHVVGFMQDAFQASRAQNESIEAVLASVQQLPSNSQKWDRRTFRDWIRHFFLQQRRPGDANSGVVLGTPESLRGRCFDVVFLCGLREGEWPGRIQEGPVLNDEERAALNRALGAGGGLEDRSQRYLRQEGEFWSVAHAARKGLVLSFARLDPTTGAERLPSVFLMRWAEGRSGTAFDYSTFSELPFVRLIPLERRNFPEDGPIWSLAEFDQLALMQLPLSQRRRYLTHLGTRAARSFAMSQLRSRRRTFTRFEGRVDQPENADALREFLRRRVFSASQLVTFVTCPQRFFYQYGLRLESLEHEARRELSRAEIGLLIHKVLERFFRQLEAGWQHREFEALRDEFLQCAETVFGEWEAVERVGSRNLWKLRKQSVVEDLVEFLRLYRQAGFFDEWRPEEFEASFGPGLPRNFDVDIDPGASPEKVRFRGSIDRIDRHESGAAIRVVDYKSGRQVRSGRSVQPLQLLLYLYAACADEPESLPRSQGSFVYVSRRGEYVQQSITGSAAVANQKPFETVVRAMAQAILAGQFFPQPGPQGSHCTICDFRSLCDSDIVSQAERKSKSGSGVELTDRAEFATKLFGES